MYIFFNYGIKDKTNNGMRKKKYDKKFSNFFKKDKINQKSISQN